MSASILPPCASLPSTAEGGTFFYTELELDLVAVTLGGSARSLLRATPVVRSRDEWNCCEFSVRVGPIVYHTPEDRYSLPILMHEVGHAYHVHMLRGLSLIASTWRCEAFAYYTVFRAYAALLYDGHDWQDFGEYLEIHEGVDPKAVGLARMLMDEPPERVVRLALAGDGYAS